MLKSTIIAVATIVISATASQAFEVCAPEVRTDVSVAKDGQGRNTFAGSTTSWSEQSDLKKSAGLSLRFVLGKANCDKVNAEAKSAKAEAITAEAEAKTAAAEAIIKELEIESTKRENEEKTLDNLIKMVKAFDALNELCEETSNKAICYKAEVLALEIANTK